MSDLVTSLRLLRDNKMHIADYRYLIRALGGFNQYGIDTPIQLSRLLDICGLEDALWAIDSCHNSEKFSTKLSKACKEHAATTAPKLPKAATRKTPVHALTYLIALGKFKEITGTERIKKWNIERKWQEQYLRKALA